MSACVCILLLYVVPSWFLPLSSHQLGFVASYFLSGSWRATQICYIPNDRPRQLIYHYVQPPSESTRVFLFVHLVTCTAGHLHSGWFVCNSPSHPSSTCLVFGSHPFDKSFSFSVASDMLHTGTQCAQFCIRLNVTSGVLRYHRLGFSDSSFSCLPGLHPQILTFLRLG